MGDGTRGYTSGGETASTIPLWGTLIGCLTSKINKESPTAHDHPPLSLLVSQTQSVLSPIPHMLYRKRAVSAGYLRDRFSILRLFRFTPLCGSFHCGSRGMYTVQVCFRFWAPCFELASQSHLAVVCTVRVLWGYDVTCSKPRMNQSHMFVQVRICLTWTPVLECLGHIIWLL